jgi:hypothetical protein
LDRNFPLVWSKPVSSSLAAVCRRVIYVPMYWI